MPALVAGTDIVLGNEEDAEMHFGIKPEGLDVTKHGHEVTGEAFLSVCQQMMKKFPNPAELYTSNYFATVDSELCDGCETCFDRCQMEALTIENGISTVDLNRCIGCGLCVSTCPTNAIQLQKKEKEIAPPRDADELYQTIMAKKMAG
jgi:Na+-translocating ferredoxin:NAD+ oxidoreductase RNF subunit RnfB